MEAMEAIEAAATHKPGVVKDGLENPAREARRRRLEIRRLKEIAHAGTSGERYLKRPRPIAGTSTALTLDDAHVFASSSQFGSLTSGLKNVAEKNDENTETVVSETAVACFGIGLVGSGSTEDNTSGLVGLCSENSSGVEEHAVRWGYASFCGRRREMEDAVAIVPGFLSVASETVGESEGSAGKSPLHFFGVYDGHGGSQVANFCKERLHRTLIEELEEEMREGGRAGGECSWQKQWEMAFVRCFNKVDSEIGEGNPRNLRFRSGEEVVGGGNDGTAPADAVGSTAVVAVVGSSQIIVSNCGDSRVVLSRGGQAIALSVDHKPGREDEMTRIEAAGGRVIQWNGYRVFGVLAMSRAIGDHYLKPYVISDPEVTFTQRTNEDECLILASDGLWDVLSNEEVCEITRRCLAKRLINHNNIAASNPSTSSSSSFSKSKSRREKGVEEMDPYMQAVAEHLYRIALQRGSSDNVTVVVVDLRKGRPQTKTS